MRRSDRSLVDDAELLRRAALGDDASAAVLVRRFVRPATLFARQLVGDADEAEDVVAEAFVIAVDRAASFRGGEPFGPWLYGIVRRVAARQRRRERRRRWLLGRWSPDRPAVADPARRAEALDQLDQVAGIMSGLPEMQRQCFQLVVEGGLEISEVATMFAIAPSTVRQHVHRAREAIRSRFHA